MRFARLWPLHIVVLALFVLLELAKFVFSRADGSMALDSQPFSDGHTLWQIVTNALFLQSFGGFVSLPPVTVAVNGTHSAGPKIPVLGVTVAEGKGEKSQERLGLAGRQANALAGGEPGGEPSQQG